MLEFKNLLNLPKNYCVPYHIMIHGHYQLVREIWPDCRIIRIQPDADCTLINLEFIRKVSLTKLCPKDIKHYFPILPKIKFKLNDFLAVDLNLIWNELEVTHSNRAMMIEQIYYHQYNFDNQFDYCISWDKFFGSVDSIGEEYQKLCNFLGCEFKNKIFETLLGRNSNNLTQLKQFDLLEECKKFNIFLNEDNYSKHRLYKNSI